jgi:hypothetical protein
MRRRVIVFSTTGVASWLDRVSGTRTIVLFTFPSQCRLRDLRKLRYGGAVPISQLLFFSGVPQQDLCGQRGYDPRLCRSSDCRTLLSTLHMSFERRMVNQMLYRSKRTDNGPFANLDPKQHPLSGSHERRLHYLDIDKTRLRAGCMQLWLKIHRMAPGHNSGWHLLPWPCWPSSARSMRLFLRLLYRYAITCCSRPNKSLTSIGHSKRHRRLQPRDILDEHRLSSRGRVLPARPHQFL